MEQFKAATKTKINMIRLASVETFSRKFTRRKLLFALKGKAKWNSEVTDIKGQFEGNEEMKEFAYSLS
jgi:hypothetical protein